MTLLDSWAWLEYFFGGRRGTKVAEYLQNPPIYISPLILAEVFSTLRRRRDESTAERCLAFMLAHSTVVPIDEELGIEAGRLHAQRRRSVKGFGMVDAVILATARRKGVRLVTGDDHFAGLSDVDIL